MSRGLVDVPGDEIIGAAIHRGARFAEIVHRHPDPSPGEHRSRGPRIEIARPELDALRLRGFGERRIAVGDRRGLGRSGERADPIGQPEPLLGRLVRRPRDDRDRRSDRQNRGRLDPEIGIVRDRGVGDGEEPGQRSHPNR